MLPRVRCNAHKRGISYSCVSVGQIPLVYMISVTLGSLWTKRMFCAEAIVANATSSSQFKIFNNKKIKWTN